MYEGFEIIEEEKVPTTALNIDLDIDQ